VGAGRSGVFENPLFLLEKVFAIAEIYRQNVWSNLVKAKESNVSHELIKKWENT